MKRVSTVILTIFANKINTDDITIITTTATSSFICKVRMLDVISDLDKLKRIHKYIFYHPETNLFIPLPKTMKNIKLYVPF